MGRSATIVLAAAAAALAAPATAAGAEVTATSSDTFSPSTVTIPVGDSVTWRNAGGFHNVKFDDGSFEEPSEPSFAMWTVGPRRFDQPGTFRYYCEYHGGPGGFGMAGRVVVQGPGGNPAPVVSALRVKPKRFCRRKTRRCPKPGARIVFRLSEAARVRIEIEPTSGDGEGQTFTRNAVAGSNSIKYSGRKLALGKYRLTLVATDDAGAASAPATTSLRVATSR
jgi:plastocyanin